MSSVVLPAGLLPPTKIKVQRFKVARHDARSMRSLEHTLTALMALPIDQRVFVVNNVEHRADDIQFDSATGFWYINVVKKRAGHGPGKYAVGQTLQGFAFSSGEAFGEDTAALYNPVTRDMYIQYNHVGVRHTGLATYLSKAAGAEPYYRILPKLQRDAERRLQGQQVTRRVELGFDLTQMTAADYQAGNSLTQMAALGADCDADKIYITMTISARDPRKRLDRRVKDSLLGMLTSTGLTKAKVVGGDEPPVQVVTTKRGKTKQVVGKGDFEPIDLIDGLMEAEFSIALGGDYRMPLAERYRALAAAQNKLR